ncbi:hypothetical protein [Agromyces laixinhei]|uniref:hypothetical protein n=1 Tax=Agromyces laixinhei TaxID=2585717 RepID=UPI0011165464|nr:hypothetical protein [Agromyces laixinhei]
MEESSVEGTGLNGTMLLAQALAVGLIAARATDRRFGIDRAARREAQRRETEVLAAERRLRAPRARRHTLSQEPPPEIALFSGETGRFQPNRPEDS